MKTTKSILNEEELDTAYAIVEEFFGTLKVDTVYHQLAHQY